MATDVVPTLHDWGSYMGNELNELKQGAETMQKKWEVDVYLNEKIVFTERVRSKRAGTAVTNVLTNIYKGDCDEVKVKEIEEVEGNGGMVVTGELIAKLVYEWANQKNMHSDDFDSLFTNELLEQMEDDKTEYESGEIVGV